MRDARAGFRNLKLYGWFALATASMLIFTLPALVLVWLGNQALVAAIVIGAGGGTLIGVGGGVFGTIASLRRAEINRLGLDAAAGD